MDCVQSLQVLRLNIEGIPDPWWQDENYGTSPIKIKVTRTCNIRRKCCWLR
jgi:hypothetical protein